MLGGLRLAAPLGVPVLGANLGRLGYLTEVDGEHLAEGARGARRRAPTPSRSASCCARDGGRTALAREHVAFNDVVLSRVPGRGQALLALHVDGQLLVRYASDGVIAATPAGSTAYSYAAGGPIVSPQTRAMIVTPDAPHGLFNRAVVLGAEESLGVEVLPNSAPVAVEVDGQLLVEADPGWTRRDHPEPVAGARRAAGLRGLRRARAAQARHHRSRRAGQLRLRRPRALGSGRYSGRALRARQCSGRSGCSRKTMWSSVPEAATVPDALERLLEVVGLERDLEDAELVGSAPPRRPAARRRAPRAPARRAASRSAGEASRRSVVVPLRECCRMAEHDRIAVVTGAGLRARARGHARAAGRRLPRGAGRAARGGAARDARRRGRRARAARSSCRPTSPTRDAVAALFARVRDELGRLDLLFNNAGTSARPAPLRGR